MKAFEVILRVREAQEKGHQSFLWMNETYFIVNGVVRSEANPTQLYLYLDNRMIGATSCKSVQSVSSA